MTTPQTPCRGDAQQSVGLRVTPRLWFRTTLGLRRVDGDRRIAHEHTSVPFHMDGSYRAATDLRP